MNTEKLGGRPDTYRRDAQEFVGGVAISLLAMFIAIAAVLFAMTAKNDNYRLQRDVRHICAVIVYQIGEHATLTDQCDELGE